MTIYGGLYVAATAGGGESGESGLSEESIKAVMKKLGLERTTLNNRFRCKVSVPIFCYQKHCFRFKLDMY